MNRSTKILQFDPSPEDPFGPSATPIYQTATFRQESPMAFGRYDYSRTANPTRSVLEEHLATLEEASHGFAFSSGMAALATWADLLSAGDRLVVGNDLYGGTNRLLSEIISGRGIEVCYVDATDLEQLEDALDDKTRWVLIETPTNPQARIVDLRATSELLRRHSIRLAVDNTFLSPYFQRPLTLGADLVLHSATKALSGHGDVTAGVIVVEDEVLAEAIAFRQNALGTALGPFDSWLLLRGIKTLSVRLDRSHENAQELARRLADHPLVESVYYPGLPNHPGHEIQRSQASGFGTVVSFRTGDVETSRRILEAVELFTISVSFGSVHSTASLPCAMSHAAIPAEIRRRRGLPEDLIRISLGIESVEDLWSDLREAIERTQTTRRHDRTPLSSPR